MVRVAPVQLSYNPKSFWFDPVDLDLSDGDRVIVSTERGTEYGVCSGDTIEVDDDEIAKLKTPLKPVLRIATEQDLEQVEAMRVKSVEALPVFKQMAAEMNENMHPVTVEYLFDGDKAIFFFEAEERVDFRDLVRRLANELKVRVDMRQIGVRDEARMVGGLGHCGQELCCKRLGGEFNPVSIRMAKEQDLSLNPAKISGVCGRLMCCLRYEFDAYKDFKSRAPKQGAKITTPAGTAKVVELNVPKETVTVQLEEDRKRVTFPLSAMDEPAEGEKRPRSIGDVFEEYANPDPFASTMSLGLFDTAGFTGTDKLGEAVARHNPQRKEEEPKKSTRKRRRKRSSGSGADRAQTQDTQVKDGQGRSSQAKDDQAKDGQGSSRSSSRRRRRRSGSGAKENAATTAQVRPGQKSSALSGGGAAREAKAPEASTHRTSRRRSHKTWSDSNES